LRPLPFSRSSPSLARIRFEINQQQNGAAAHTILSQAAQPIQGYRTCQESLVAARFARVRLKPQRLFSSTKPKGDILNLLSERAKCARPSTT
jgi:hypothetical protein